jgi:hypothetical protein
MIDRTILRNRTLPLRRHREGALISRGEAIAR